MQNPYKDFSNINPQRGNGHREIENSVFQALIRADLSGIEYSVVLCVIDKTWGFSRTEDVIPLSQFAEATKQDRGNIAKAIHGLEEKHLILIEKSGPGRGKANVYMFNKHWDTWKLPPKKEKGVQTTPFQEMVSASQQLASNGVTGTPITESPDQPKEMVSAPQQLASNGVTGTPLGKGVEATPIKTINGVKNELNGVTSGVENGVALTPSKEIKKISKEISSIKEKGGYRPPVPSPPDSLTPVTRASHYLFEKTKRRRWANLVQKEQFEKAETEVGFDRMKEAIDWALTSGIANIKSIITAALKGRRHKEKGGSYGRAEGRYGAQKGGTDTHQRGAEKLGQWKVTESGGLIESAGEKGAGDQT